MSQTEGYSFAKGGKLKLKNESKSSHKKHKKSKKRKSDAVKDDKLEDELNHAGGWLVESFDQVTGSIFVELKEYMYMHGLDNGLFVLGAPHEPGEQPEPSELLSAIKADDKHVALKSAYGKFLSVNQNGLLVGRSDAVSSKEYFELEFDYDYDGRKIYMRASNGKYVGVNHDGDIVAMAEDKTDMALEIRSLKKKSEKNKERKDKLPEEERSDDLKNVELNYVKKFQKFQDKRIRLNEGDVSDLTEAKVQGILHEKLLDRREKMKADRYCK